MTTQLAPNDLEFRVTDVAAVVRDVTHALQFTCATADVRLRCLLAESLPPLTVGKLALKRALMHLCDNALEAMPAGGTLTLEAVEVNGRIEIRVSDTGVGVIEGVDVFASGTTTKDEACGLGLYIVQQIVSRHGGSILVESDIGVGATFLLIFPASKNRATNTSCS